MSDAQRDEEPAKRAGQACFQCARFDVMIAPTDRMLQTFCAYCMIQYCLDRIRQEAISNRNPNEQGDYRSWG